jgi:hypothetical protein
MRVAFSLPARIWRLMVRGEHFALVAHSSTVSNSFT